MPDNPQDETWKAGREEKSPEGDPTPNDGWTDADFSEIRRRVTETAKQRAEAAKEGRLNTITGGQMGTPVEDIVVDYQPSQDEVVWPIDHKKRNSGIIFGKDKDQSSTFGPYNGLQGSYAVDIVVGRLSSQRGRVADNTTIQTPFYGADAARIYLSQRTDIDKNFGLADGNIGSEEGKSGIGIKADGVRIIGRRGVKIVTGRMKGQDEKDSKGQSIPTAAPIELIAGNNTGDRQVSMSLNAAGATSSETIKALQPLLKGDNTVAAFKELSEILDRLMGALLNMVLIQTSFNSTIGVTVYPLAHHVSAGAVSATQLLANVQNSLYHSRINKTMWELNYFETFGGKYICSKNVFAT
tara:strand:- start:2891 stop:3952 length:1062 start_codon:yes stop_codon:yes gene_type:complete